MTIDEVIEHERRAAMEHSFLNYAEAIHRQTVQIDKSIREMNRKIAAGYLSNLCEYCTFNGIDFEHDDINCTIDFDGLRRKAGMEQ